MKVLAIGFEINQYKPLLHARELVYCTHKVRIEGLI